MHNMINIVNTAKSYIKKLNELFSHHKKKFFYLVVYLYKMMDVYQAIISYNHFRMHASQIIMLHTFNWHSAVCQLSLNKTERGNSIKNTNKQKKSKLLQCQCIHHSTNFVSSNQKINKYIIAHYRVSTDPVFISIV